MFCAAIHALAAAPLDERCDEMSPSRCRAPAGAPSCSPQPNRMALLGCATAPRAVDGWTPTTNAATDPTNSARTQPGRRRRHLGLAPRADRSTAGLSSSHLWLRARHVDGASGAPPVTLAFLRTHRVAALMTEPTGVRADSSRGCCRCASEALIRWAFHLSIGTSSLSWGDEVSDEAFGERSGEVTTGGPAEKRPWALEEPDRIPSTR
jgi:hypothetical protein